MREDSIQVKKEALDMLRRALNVRIQKLGTIIIIIILKVGSKLVLDKVIIESRFFHFR